MATKEDLLSDVLRLPPEERAEVAHRLLLSLEESEDPGAEAEWSEELERRAREVLDGSVKTVPWEQVEARISTRIRQRR
jgi:putative addiction module component (TIGR02574 family)